MLTPDGFDAYLLDICTSLNKPVPKEEIIAKWFTVLRKHNITEKQLEKAAEKIEADPEALKILNCPNLIEIAKAQDGGILTMRANCVHCCGEGVISVPVSQHDGSIQWKAFACNCSNGTGYRQGGFNCADDAGVIKAISNGTYKRLNGGTYALQDGRKPGRATTKPSQPGDNSEDAMGIVEQLAEKLKIGA